MCTYSLNACKHDGEVKMNRINAAIEHVDDRNTGQRITIFSAKGSLTKSTASEVRILMHRLLSNESRIVNLDMSGLDSFDIWGASQLAKTICQILARGQEFNIWCDNLKVRNLLKLLHINVLVPVLGADSQTSVPTLYSVSPSWAE